MLQNSVFCLSFCHQIFVFNPQVAAVDEDLSSDDSGAKKRREILARRPSYRYFVDLKKKTEKLILFEK